MKYDIYSLVLYFRCKYSAGMENYLFVFSQWESEKLVQWTIIYISACKDSNRELKQATFLTTRTLIGSEFDVFDQSWHLLQPLWRRCCQKRRLLKLSNIWVRARTFLLKADFHSAENVARSTFYDRFLLKYKHSSGTNVLGLTFQKKAIAKSWSRGKCRAIDFLRALSFEIQTFKRNECAWLHTFQKKAIAKSRSREIFRWMEIRLKVARYSFTKNR